MGSPEPWHGTAMANGMEQHRDMKKSRCVTGTKFISVSNQFYAHQLKREGETEVKTASTVV